MIKHLLLVLFILIVQLPLKSQNFSFTEIRKLSENVNSPAEESMPVISPDGKTLFFVRTFYEGNTGGRLSGQDIWMSRRGDDGEWTNAVNNMPFLNNDRNNAVLGISQNESTIYLLDSYGPVSNKLRGIATATKTPLGWSQPMRLPINGLEAGNSFLGFYMTPDETVLLVSMKTNQKAGGEDLFVSLKQADGKWSEPKNLGATINTRGFEISPFLSEDKKTLFFSSDGHGGQGGADIFMSQRLYDSWVVWSKPVNLGPEINSPDFDAYFFLNEKNKEAFFVSNREGSFADIYTATLSDKAFEDRQAIINPGKYRLTNDEVNELLGLPLSRTIFFEFNSYDVAAPSRELIYFLANKLIEFPEYQIELIGHTDQEGTEDYNLQLSLNRAREVGQYFRSFGIVSSRISTTGLGKSKPIVTEGTEVEMAKNRRVEIYFIK
ncbi:MAG: OmpA family protein [Cyclobacteriaceae bacterium]|nr:OmpA family protein [Cyclobacteriaceae bacterium]